MQVHEFCGHLNGQLDRVQADIPKANMTLFRDKVQQFQAASEPKIADKEATIAALFQLFLFFQEQAAAIPASQINATVVPLISTKLQEFSPLRHSPKPSAEPVVPPSFHGCAGLRNRSNKCYVYGCCKGLWASKKFREVIERKAAALEERQSAEQEGRPSCRLTALYLHRLFITFDGTTPSEIIEPEEQALHDVLKEMARYHPAVAEGKAQDASEFLSWLFEDIFDPQEFLFSYVENKRRPQELTASFCIPNIDCQETTQGNLFIVQLPAEEGAQVELQSAFEPTMTEETIEPEAVLASEANKGKNQEEIVAKLAKMPRKVHVRHTKLFTGEPPPCLFVHLVRQVREVDVPVEQLKAELDAKMVASLGLKDQEIEMLWGRKEAVKVGAKVDVAPTLCLHHADSGQIRYRLRAVVVHTGLADAGHYYSYLATEQQDQSSATKGELQSPLEGVSFVRHDDHRVVKVPYSQALERELQQQAYVLMYDKDK